MDWRDTTEVLRQQSYAPDTPIFVKSGFIEARSPKWFNDEVRLGFLIAPIRMYPTPGTIVALPHEPGPSSEGYMANAVRGLSSREEFFVVDRERPGVATVVSISVRPDIHGRRDSNSIGARRSGHSISAPR